MKRSERAAGRKYHYIYKTTCLVTGKYYIGMHSTNDLDDGYVGSGKRLWHSINKHGLENHKLEILEQLPSRASLKAREAELVNESLLQDPMCMNLKLGGEGGWEYVNDLLSQEHRIHLGSVGGYANMDKLSSDAKRRCADGWKLGGTIAMNKINADIKNGIRVNHWIGKSHSEESKNKIKAAMSEKVKGQNNPMFGKIWIHNLAIKEAKIIQADQLENYISEGWCKGRKKFN